MKRLFAISLVCAVGCLLIAISVQAQVQRVYVEDFTTDQFHDAASSTAVWDTVAGQIRMGPFALTLVGSVATPGDAQDIVVAGDYAYVACGYNGMQVVDITDPENPVLAGGIDTPAYAMGIDVAGNWAYIADNPSALMTVNITNPTSPTPGAGFAAGQPSDVDVFGNYAYIAAGATGLVVANVTNPAAPSMAGGVTLSEALFGVQVEGAIAYMAAPTFGLRNIGVGIPTSPGYAGGVATPGGAYGLHVCGDLGFIADADSGLQVVNVSNVTAPSLMGACELGYMARDVEVSGDYAYVACADGGLFVVDVADPWNPTPIGSVDTPGEARGLAIDGLYAFVADHTGGVAVVKICEITQPLTRAYYNTPGAAYGVEVAGDNAFVADANNLHVVNISDPLNPTFRGQRSSPGTAYRLDVVGNWAFAALWHSTYGMGSFSVQNPSSPGFYAWVSGNQVKDIVVDGENAFVAHASGFQTIDIANPTAPALRGTYGVSNGFAVAVDGDNAFLGTDSWSGLYVLNVSNPWSPGYRGHVGGFGYLTDIEIAGDYAYAADRYGSTTGLRVIDISNPSSPTLAGTGAASGYSYGLDVVGNLAFLAAFYSYLVVVDITEPTSPAQLAYAYVGGRPNDVWVEGDYAFVATYTYGLATVEVFQRFLDPVASVIQSLPVGPAGETVAGARLSATHTPTATWSASADNGSTWTPIAPGGGYTYIPPGDQFLWRSVFEYPSGGVTPSCSDVQFEFLFNYAVIDSIVDVPGDDGGWARVYFTRSGRDFAEEAAYPIATYHVYRRVDGGAAAPNSPATPSGLPPGTWEAVGSVPGHQDDQYVCRVPTAADATINAFCVVAQTTTPSVHYTSPTDSGMSMDNLAPGAPEGFSVAYHTGGGNRLAWDPSEAPDCEFYRVYRSFDESFEPAPEHLAHTTGETSWQDPEYDDWDVYYLLTAVDDAANESDPASPGTVTGTPAPEIVAFRLHQNVPNPFARSSSIAYDVPVGGAEVILCVYDVSGRLVRTLVTGYQTSGPKRVSWDGRNDRGDRVATGVYLYQMTAPGFDMTRKMVLLR